MRPVELAPAVGALPFRKRLALALAVLFGRDVVIPYVMGPATLHTNRAQRRAAARL